MSTPSCSESPIARAILRYYPDWEAPADHHEWNKCLCPFHGDETPSAAVSYDLQGFNCLACGVRGDVISIIRHEEEVSFAEAQRIAADLSVGSNVQVPRKPERKSSRRVFGESRPARTPRSTVRTGIRGRPTPWS
ncbi:DNA primase [Mycobacterium phage SemperFi]|uniref:DNA primase n=1 Tax=Mycobacterium phage Georgie2 TaxID=2743928 RepID=A0A7D5JRL8_9CAUD|nr:DNA primase [Mycobacterium phage SweetiePie]YP_010063867.1 DNA primase [Mycobacterium phage Georgie2]AIS73822.1 DNA primase [Mycobacterium phage Power]ATN91918.1 DNA primase [Mycobacterium phage SnapTap]AXC33276.1 DNA primase [Mycobacterium phage Crucio]AXQ52986.1 DNA primase [Mycobacterium phage QueenBeesly]QFG11895.1 DNA primase [Mycobacterium phage SemperFi]QKY80125.1 DNA primase [Mycobacterium Phage FiringLine]